MARVQVTPETFTLVQYDAGVIAGLTEELAASVGVPDDVPIAIEVDEELPLPLTGMTSDVVDGKASLWFSGANFEDQHRQAQMSEQHTRSDLAVSLFRVVDRLGAGFADAPIDEELTDAQRQAWESWAEGRADRLGEFSRKVRRQYHFRLYNGFTDTADAAFDRFWSADTGAFTWADVQTIVDECEAVDPRPKPKDRAAIRKETLKPAS